MSAVLFSYEQGLVDLQSEALVYYFYFISVLTLHTMLAGSRIIHDCTAINSNHTEQYRGDLLQSIQQVHQLYSDAIQLSIQLVAQCCAAEEKCTIFVVD
eukprot:3498394-Rhodomonas_salina.1